MKRVMLALILLAFLCGCAKNTETPELPDQRLLESKESEAAVPPTVQAVEAPKEPEPPALSEKDAFILGLMDKMSLEQKVGQMLLLSFETAESGGALLELDAETIAALEKYKPGGIIYFAGNIDTASQTLSLSEAFQKNSEIPLFIATDEEGGRVSRITRSGKIDAVKIPSAKEIGNTGDSEKAYEAALAVSKELKALGINVDFAPCADLNGDNQGVIGDRAYSGEPEIAAEFVQKAVEGFADGGVICALKHFPGHGAAPGDTHDEKIMSEKSLAEIQGADLLPFTAGIRAGQGEPMVMLSHITLPEWGAPASLSKEAVDYLRERMGFEGVIITDSLRMGAIVNYYGSAEAAVSAVNAGVNILLTPENTEEAYNAVVSSVLSGEISEEAINASVCAILSLKYDYGLFDY